MSYNNLEIGDYVKVDIANQPSTYYKILEFLETEVKVKNLHNGSELVLGRHYIGSILTKPYHLEKIGFKKNLVDGKYVWREKPVEMYILGDIKIYDLNIPIVLSSDSWGLYGNGFTPIDKPLDYLEIAKDFKNSLFPDDSFYKKCPKLSDINSLFKYLDSKGVNYDKEAVALIEPSI